MNRETKWYLEIVQTRIRNYLQKSRDVPGLRSLRGITPWHPVSTRGSAHVCITSKMRSFSACPVFCRCAVVAIFQVHSFTPPTGVNLFSPGFMPFFYCSAWSHARLWDQTPPSHQTLGNWTEIRLGRKARAHNVGEEMAYPSPWQQAHIPIVAHKRKLCS